MHQGLAWLFYKHMHVCVCVMRSCFPMCGINLITCLVRPQGNGGNSPHHPHPHSNRRCCPFPSPACWPLQWPAPGPPERERDSSTERERDGLHTCCLQSCSDARVCAPAAFVCTWKETRSEIHIKQDCQRADQTHTPSKSPRRLWFLSSLLHTPFLFVCSRLTLL